MRIALIDTGHANLRSVERAVTAAAADLDAHTASRFIVERTRDPDVVRKCDKMVVPGQGGFGDCLKGLRENGLDEVICEEVRAGKSYLGICLGLQALFASSPEAPGVQGLGLLPGRCEKLEPTPGFKIPHMGWNQLELRNGGHPVLQAAGGEGSWVYFVHSYHGCPTDPTVIKAVVQHGPHEVTAAVAYENIIATQFHPEKSQSVGLNLLEGFLRL